MHEEMKMEIEELHKEIDLVQGCINRMAQNSFHIKGWTVCCCISIASGKNCTYTCDFIRRRYACNFHHALVYG